MVNLFYLGGVRYTNLFCFILFFYLLSRVVALVVLAYLIKLLIARLKKLSNILPK